MSVAFSVSLYHVYIKKKSLKLAFCPSKNMLVAVKAADYPLKQPCCYDYMRIKAWWLILVRATWANIRALH